MTPRAPATASPAAARAFSIHALFPLLAAAIWGGMYVVSKWSFAELPPVTLGLARMVLGGLACWLLTTTTPAFVILFWEVSRRSVAFPSPGGLFAILYLGLASTALAWFLWYKGLEGLPAGVVAVFFFAQPVVGGILAWLFLGEQLGPAFLAGGAVIASGILLAARG